MVVKALKKIVCHCSSSASIMKNFKKNFKLRRSIRARVEIFFDHYVFSIGDASVTLKEVSSLHDAIFLKEVVDGEVKLLIFNQT